MIPAITINNHSNYGRLIIPHFKMTCAFRLEHLGIIPIRKRLLRPRSRWNHSLSRPQIFNSKILILILSGVECLKNSETNIFRRSSKKPTY